MRSFFVLWSAPVLLFFSIANCADFNFGACQDGSASTSSADCLPAAPDNISYRLDEDTVGTFTVMWSSIEAVDTYDLQEVCTTASLSEEDLLWQSAPGQVFKEIEVTENSVEISGKSFGETCWYRVRACNRHGCGPFSPTPVGVQVPMSPPMPPPPLTAPSLMSDESPQDLSTDGLYVISWSSVADAVEYILEESSDDGSTWVEVYRGANLNYSANQDSSGAYQYRLQLCGAGSVCGEVGNVFSITVLVLTAPFLMSDESPQDLSIDGLYVISWSSVTDAVEYILEESSDAGSTWAEVYRGANLNYSANQDSGGAYQYRLQLCGAGSVCGEVGNVFSITVLVLTAPPLMSDESPQDLSTDGLYVISWSSVADAVEYILEESSDAGSTWAEVYRGANLNYSANQDSSGAYQYRLQLCGAGSVCGEVGNVFSITVLVLTAPPLMSDESPQDLSTDGLYVISWSSVADAVEYILEESGDGGSTWAEVYRGANLNYSANQDSSGAYQYRLQLCGAGSVCGEVGNVFSITVLELTAPSLMSDESPQDLSTDGLYVISWSSVTDAVEYILEESSDAGSTWAEVYRGANLNYSANQDSSGAYQYRLQLCGAGSVCGEVGNVFSITVLVLTAPSLMSDESPQDLSTDGLYVISWSSVADAVEYILEESSDGGSTWAEVYRGANLNYSANQDSGGAYQYRLQLCGAGSVCGEVGSVFSITVLVLTAPPLMSDESPQDLSTDGLYVISWSSVADAVEYILEESSDAGSTWVEVYRGADLNYSANQDGSGAYQYRLQLCGAGSVCGEVGNAFSITVAVSLSGSGTLGAPYIITTYAQLDLLRDDLNAYYRVDSDIDASPSQEGCTPEQVTPNERGEVSCTAAGFLPMGTESNPFSGNLDGNGKVIRNLYIKVSDIELVGLLRVMDATAEVRNISIENAYISFSSSSSPSSAGVLVGFNNLGTITNSYVAGTVFSSVLTLNTHTGGLVGRNRGIITNSYAAATIYSFAASTTSSAGGLVGFNDAGTITNSYAISSTFSFASDSTLSFSSAGGLVGFNDTGIITNSYAAGTVSSLAAMASEAHAGGLVGYSSSGTIVNSYAVSSIFAAAAGLPYAGGLVGFDDGGTIANSYATGSVASSSSASIAYSGGLAGNIISGTVLMNDYWDSDTADLRETSGGTVFIRSSSLGQGGSNSGITGLSSNQMTATTAPYPDGLGSAFSFTSNRYPKIRQWLDDGLDDMIGTSDDNHSTTDILPGQGVFAASGFLRFPNTIIGEPSSTDPMFFYDIDDSATSISVAGTGVNGTTASGYAIEEFLGSGSAPTVSASGIISGLASLNSGDEFYLRVTFTEGSDTFTYRYRFKK